MAHWINVLRINGFVNPTRLPLLCEKTGALAIVEPGSYGRPAGRQSGRLAGRQSGRPLGRRICCKVRKFICIYLTFKMHIRHPE